MLKVNLPCKFQANKLSIRGEVIEMKHDQKFFNHPVYDWLYQKVVKEYNVYTKLLDNPEVPFMTHTEERPS